MSGILNSISELENKIYFIMEYPMIYRNEYTLDVV